MAIFEMNALPSPKWADEYVEYLVRTFKCSKVDAICAVGELEHLMRIYKKDEH